MFTAMAMSACHKLAVPMEVMQHIVHVESDANPYAIGVVGGQLIRQPRDLGEALATVHMLDAKGYNYSLGVAQVNRANLDKYGLNSYEQAFDPCRNLVAGANILAECYASARGNWGNAFSCYYSGNFVNGYRDGYVQKVYDSFASEANTSGDTRAPSLLQMDGISSSRHEVRRRSTASQDNAALRVAIRSEALGAPFKAALAAADAAPAFRSTDTLGDHSQRFGYIDVAGLPQAPEVAATSAAPDAQGSSNATSSVFVPQVHGPDDAIPPSANAGAPTPDGGTELMLPTADTEPPHFLQKHDDAAFVF